MPKYLITNLEKSQTENVFIHIGIISINPASIAAGTVGETSVTFLGVPTNAYVVALPVDTLEAGLVPQGARVTAVNTVAVRIYNPTAGAIDGIAKNWLLIALIPNT